MSGSLAGLGALAGALGGGGGFAGGLGGGGLSPNLGQLAPLGQSWLNPLNVMTNLPTYAQVQNPQAYGSYLQSLMPPPPPAAPANPAANLPGTGAMSGGTLSIPQLQQWQSYFNSLGPGTGQNPGMVGGQYFGAISPQMQGLMNVYGVPSQYLPQFINNALMLQQANPQAPWIQYAAAQQWNPLGGAGGGEGGAGGGKGGGMDISGGG